MPNRFIAVLTTLLLATLAFAEPPRVFHDEGYKSARAASDESGKMLVVDFTASWCGPCKRMDADTWTNSRVEEWLKANTVSVQVDVDEQPKIAKKYSVSAMPTVVVVKDGEPFDRKVGYQGPDQLIAWLTGVKEGKSTEMVLRDAIESGDLSGPALVSKRQELARLLLDSGDYEEATRQYVWLWNNMLEHDRSMVGVRASFMLGEIERLIDAHDPTRARFESIRAEAREGVDARRSLQDLMDWVALSVTLGHDDEVLAWYDAHKDSPRDRKAIERVSFRLRDIFVEHKRWEDLGESLQNPAMTVQMRAGTLNSSPGIEMSDTQREQLFQMMFSSALEITTHYHTALLAADREVDAFRVANILLEKLEGERLAQAKADIVRHALEAGYQHDKHLEWLEATGDASLARRVRAALNERE